MFNVLNILFNTFFAICGGLIGTQINKVAMFLMSFVGASIGQLMWTLVVEVLC